MTNEPGLKPVDPVLCASIQTKQRMEETIKEILVPWKTYWKHEMPFFVRETHPDCEQIIAEDEGPPKYLVDILQRMNEQHEINKIDPTPAETTTDP